MNKYYCILLGLYSYYVGQKPHILVTDLDMLKQIMVKEFNNFMDHEVGAFC